MTELTSAHLLQLVREEGHSHWQQYEDIQLSTEEYERVYQKIARLICEEVTGRLPASVSERLDREHLRVMARIQYSLYELDYYGERSRCIQKVALSRMWKRVEHTLGRLPCELVKLLEAELKKLHRLEEYEVKLHSGWRPRLCELLHVYTYKCADVDLLKKVALWFSGEHDFMKRYWRYHMVSVIREVLDDWRDMREDEGEMNSNSVLELRRRIRLIGCQLVGLVDAGFQSLYSVLENIGSCTRRDRDDDTRGIVR